METLGPGLCDPGPVPALIPLSKTCVIRIPGVKTAGLPFSHVVKAGDILDWTWTLAGIAGLVLSIGMAVDSNVLIFERIKEEIRSGRSIASATYSGFKRALLTIIDTHVTTVAASAFLFVFGTGPVKGFAVTLVIGLLANLFTAVFVSRAIFGAFPRTG